MEVKSSRPKARLPEKQFGVGDAVSGPGGNFPSDRRRAPSGDVDPVRMPGRRALSFFSGVKTLFSGDSALPRSTVVSSFLINVLGLALPLVMLQIYDRILANQSVATLGYLMIGLATAILIEACLKVIRAYLMSWSATKQNFLSNLDAVNRAVYAPPDKFEKEPSNVWMDRFESLDQFNAFSAGQSRLIMLDLPFVAIYVAVIFLVAGSLGFVLIGMVALFVAVIVLRAKALRRVLAERSEHNGRRDDFIAETLQGIESVKSMAMEPQMQRRFERLQQTNSAISHRNMSLSNELQTYSQLISNVVLISTVTAGAVMAIHGLLSVGTLACCTLLTSRVMQPVMRGIQVLMELESAQLARENAAALFELPEVETAEYEAETLWRGEISLANATHLYKGAVKPALRHVYMHAEPGEIIGIRGEHASGKSTLIKLISGELAPTAGICQIDGRDAHTVSHAEMSRNIVYVSQDSAIFEGTIMDNITMFRSGPQRIKNARQAARLIALEDDIHRMPQGYDTPIGQGIAEALPRGMVQRITIARALALEPAILLFDEANSMLDMRSDAALKDGLMRLKGHLTVLLISNRPSLLAIADKRFELKNGIMIEQAPAPGACAPVQVQTA